MSENVEDNKKDMRISMELFERIYSIASACVIIAIMIGVAKYVYMEPCFGKTKQKVAFFVTYFVIEFAFSLYSGELGEVGMILTMLGSFSIMICITRKRKRIRGLFLVFPVFGMSMALCMVPVFVIIAFMGISLENIYEQKIFDVIGYAFAIPCIILLIRNRHRWKIGVAEDIVLGVKEPLNKWERRLLNVNGMVMLVICGFIVYINDIGNMEAYERYLIAGSVFFVVMMGCSVVMMVLKSNCTHYYMDLAKMNEYYLNAQMEHFHTYQETQRETRRIRHDMKNHLLCIRELQEQKKYEEMGAYIEGLNNQVMNIDQELHIGNDVADAIINEKNMIAKANGITIYMEGSLSGIESIMPLDICTLFANALDNCLESLRGSEIQVPFIEISVRREKRMILISFINPVEHTREVQNDMKPVTTKESRENHGFGLENIRMTAKKYKGEINCSILNWDNEAKVFRLEVMLMS